VALVINVGNNGENMKAIMKWRERNKPKYYNGVIMSAMKIAIMKIINGNNNGENENM